jgi:hypothetical protein
MFVLCFGAAASGAYLNGCGRLSKAVKNSPNRLIRLFSVRALIRSTHNPPTVPVVYANGGAVRPQGASQMWIGIAIVLLLLWAGGFFAFHVAGFLIHILLICAVVAFVIHFITGRRTAV